MYLYEISLPILTVAQTVVGANNAQITGGRIVLLVVNVGVKPTGAQLCVKLKARSQCARILLGRPAEKETRIPPVIIGCACIPTLSAARARARKREREKDM